MTKTAATGGKVYMNYVEQWLDTPASETVKSSKNLLKLLPSIIEIWVYAGILRISRYIQRFEPLGEDEV